ncbi:MAG TPA: hypothetical protein VGM03_12560 [Phycisphaerae bacterium]|jgi:hypothetical protein
MPYDDPDPVDPMVLNAMAFDVEDEAAIREMAECFIEEYFRLGFEPERILHMFRVRGYAGPNLAYYTLGEPVIRTMINELAPLWAGRSAMTQYETSPAGDVCLPVLDG